MNLVGTENSVIFDENLQDIKNIKISIIGDNNKIIFKGKLSVKGTLTINIKADNNNIVFEEDIVINKNLNIFILPAGSGCPSYENSVSIGKECFFNGNCNLILAENNNTINIGANCLLASDITFNTSDSHPVFSLVGGERLNNSLSINIGEHVWIGHNVHFLKGSGIKNDSVVGAHSIVTKFFNESNIAIAGNPSKIIRSGITWRQDARIQNINDVDN